MIYPSIRERNWNPEPLFEALMRGAEASEQIQRKRLYVKAISAGMEQFPEEVNLALSSMDVDLLTRQMFELSFLNMDQTESVTDSQDLDPDQTGESAGETDETL